MMSATTSHYGPGALQTYTYYPLTDPSSSSSPPATNPNAISSSSSSSSESKPIWLLYLHGGAWRDPSQTPAQILPAVTHLRTHLDNSPPSSGTATTTATTTTPRIAGILSINYRLSPYPSHATDPSSPTDPERNVRHPTHVRDVAAAVRCARERYGVERWVAMGHSCGATLWLQVVEGIGLDDGDGDDDGEEKDAGLLSGLEALVLLEGIYDIPILLKNHAPPHCSEEIAGVYRSFVRGAFGEDRVQGGGKTRSVYAAVSPTNGVYAKERWRDARLVVVGYSDEDTLVECEQGDVRVSRCRELGWADEGGHGNGEDRVLVRKGLKGDHDDVWGNGKQIADLILEVAERLSR